MPSDRPDLIILGGGLAGGLVALALAARRPDLKVTIVEAGETLGGNHVWSFFDSDIAPADRALVEPLIVHRWPGYDVRFPGHSRTIGEPYNSIESEHFDRVVRAALPADAIVRGGRRRSDQHVGHPGRRPDPRRQGGDRRARRRRSRRAPLRLAEIPRPDASSRRRRTASPARS